MIQVFIGDSIVAGNELNHSGQGGTNDTNQRWSTRYCADNSYTENNYSQSGRCLSIANGGNNSFEYNKTDIPNYNSSTFDKLFFYFGGNDVAAGGGYASMHTAFVAKYQEMLQYLKNTKGWPANKIVCCWMYWSDDLAGYNITVSGMRTIWNELVNNAIDPEGCAKLDFHPYINSLSGKADYSHNPANDSFDYIHPQNYPSFHANQIMADYINQGVVYPGATNPTVNVGVDKTITFPTLTSSATATANDPDGTISSYAWTKISGPSSYVISSPTASSTNFTGLSIGSYVFRCTVTDNSGATAYDEFTLTVNYSSTPIILLGENGESNIVSRAPYVAEDMVNAPSGCWWYKQSTNELIHLDETQNESGEGAHRGFSMRPQLAKRLQELTGYNIIIVPAAWGGTSLEGWSKNGGLFETALALWNPALDFCTNNNIPIAHKFIHFHQGANNLFASKTDGYYVGLRQLVIDTINDFGCEKIFGTRTAYGNPNDYPSWFDMPAGSEGIMKAQKILNYNSPDWIMASYSPPTFTQANGKLLYDLVHYTMKGQNQLAEELAQAINYYLTTGNKISLTETVASLQSVTSGYIDLSQNWNYPLNGNLLETGGHTFLRFEDFSTNLFEDAVYEEGGVRLDGTRQLSFSRPFETNKFTIEINFRLQSFDPKTHNLLAGNDIQNNYLFINVNGIDSSYILAKVGGTGIYFDTSGMDFTQYQTLKLVQASGTVKLFLNGVEKVSTASTNKASFSSIGLAASPSAMFNGIVNYATFLDDNETGVPNNAPNVNVGADASITLPTNSFSRTATATDSDGTIASYQWSKTSGPSTYTISSPTAATTNFTNLVQGSYVFRCTVTDNGSLTAYDEFTLDVQAAIAPTIIIKRRVVIG